jgi:hypothetical protein
LPLRDLEACGEFRVSPYQGGCALKGSCASRQSMLGAFLSHA